MANKVADLANSALMDEPDLTQTLDGVGERLRAVRHQRGGTLAQLSAATGISVSTLSRLESGERRPSLELLLPLARVHDVPLDELVGAPPTGDPRVHLRPRPSHDGTTVVPLTRRPGGIQAFKMVYPPRTPPGEPQLKVHEGYDWLYVLAGRMRVLLGEHDVVLGPGEVAEFDTRTPHWIGNPFGEPAEVLGLFGPQGERLHVRTAPRGSGVEGR